MSLDGSNMARELGEDSSSMALCYLRNVVAWTSAMVYIFDGVKVSSSFKDITLDFVVTPITYPDTCAPEEDFVESGISYMLNNLNLWFNPQSEIAKSLIEEFKERVLPVKFSGTVHCDCEASLMGRIAASQHEMIPLPNGMKREELEGLKVLSNCIYVS